MKLTFYVHLKRFICIYKMRKSADMKSSKELKAGYENVVDINRNGYGILYSNWSSIINTTPSVPHPSWPDAPCATFATWLHDLRRLLSANINLFNSRLYRVSMFTIFISSSYFIGPFVVGLVLCGEQSRQNGISLHKICCSTFGKIDSFYFYSINNITFKFLKLRKRLQLHACLNQNCDQIQ